MNVSNEQTKELWIDLIQQQLFGSSSGCRSVPAYFWLGFFHTGQSTRNE